jgi:hypothetical protein
MAQFALTFVTPLLLTPMGENLGFEFVGLAYQGKVVVFRFIIEYSILKDFGPYGIDLFYFLYEDF